MKRQIIYFDDDEDVLRMFEQTFSSQYDVRISTGLEGARELLQSCRADIVISDQEMPEISGTEFLREASQSCPESVRILVTGVVPVGRVLPEVVQGIVQFFIAKPWDFEKMRDLLERAVLQLNRGG